MKSLTKHALLLCILLLNTFLLRAQSDFSGTWILDHSKSDAEFRDYEITCNINQTTSAITVEQIIVMKDGQKSAMAPITYNTDGKEVSKEEQGGTNKISASLSPDRKILTTKYVRTMNGNDYGSITVYNLSDEGKVLTVKTSDLKGESPMVQTYDKK
jgi:hypothetical protein